MANKQVYESPDTRAVVDNIGDFPFVATLTWGPKGLHIKVEQPQCGIPWPVTEFECLLLAKEPEEEEDDTETDDEAFDEEADDDDDDDDEALLRLPPLDGNG